MPLGLGTAGPGEHGSPGSNVKGARGWRHKGSSRGGRAGTARLMSPQRASLGGLSLFPVSAPDHPPCSRPDPAANGRSLSSLLRVLCLARSTPCCEWPLSLHHPLHKWAKATLPVTAPWGGGMGRVAAPLPRIPVAAAWPALPWTWAPEESSGDLGIPGWLRAAASAHTWASVPWPRADGCLGGHCAHQWLPLSRLCGRDPWVSFPVRGEALPRIGASLPVLGFSFGSNQRVGPKRPDARCRSYPQCTDKTGGPRGAGGLQAWARRRLLCRCSPGTSLSGLGPTQGLVAGVLAALVGARTAPSAPLPASACSAFFPHQDSVPSQQKTWRHPREAEARGAGMERAVSLGSGGKRCMWGLVVPAGSARRRARCRV